MYLLDWRPIIGLSANPRPEINGDPYIQAVAHIYCGQGQECDHELIVSTPEWSLTKGFNPPVASIVPTMLTSFKQSLNCQQCGAVSVMPERQRQRMGEQMKELITPGWALAELFRLAPLEEKYLRRLAWLFGPGAFGHPPRRETAELQLSH